MSKIFFSLLIGLFLTISSLNASTNQSKCDMNCNHKQEMKAHCDLNKKSKSCDCKKGAECTCKGNCKCSISKKDEKAERCGCGMTKVSCEKMMPYCEFRDGKKEKM